MRNTIETAVPFAQFVKFDAQIHGANEDFSHLQAWENPEPQKSKGEDSGNEFVSHSELQAQFDAALGRKHDSRDLLQRAYNPVTDRWHIERFRKKNDKIGEQAYLKEIPTNILTNFKERLQVAESIIHYSIKDGQLFCELFPDEPFSDVLQRGAEYRLLHGTPEAEREGALGEKAGWKIIEEKFADPETPIGTVITTLSPPGIVKGSAYDRQVVDEYELIEKNGEKVIQLTRSIVDFDDKAYISAALSLDPHYFDQYDGRPLDAWYLSHPLEGALSDRKDHLQGMSHEMSEKIFASKMLQGMIDIYGEDIQAEEVDWRKIAMDFNAMLNQLDKEEHDVMDGKQINTIYLSKQAIQDEAMKLGLQNPQVKGGVGCPSSRGFEMDNTGLSYLSLNSVSSFAQGSPEKKSYSFDHEGTCVACNSGPKLLGPCDICISCDEKAGTQMLKKKDSEKTQEEMALVA